MTNIIDIEFLDIDYNKDYFNIVNRVITKCYEKEKLLDSYLCINIILTNSENIKKINSKYRNMNMETDVLSFPMFEKKDLQERLNNKDKYTDILGDVVISIEKVKIQAEEYKHSFKRELSYMTVHGFYHLLGYDHINEQGKTEMRLKEEEILQDLDILRK